CKVAPNAFIIFIDESFASDDQQARPPAGRGDPVKIDTAGVQGFIAVAEHRNFRRAAAELHITQTALSRRLQTLEAFLGVKLIERTTRSVELTQIGREFLPRSRRLLGELETALTEIRE